MKNNKIKILISAMTLALIGLITLQIFWSVKTIEMEGVKFDATINKVLSDVVLKMEKGQTANVLIEKVIGKSGSVVWVENNADQNDSTNVVFFSRVSNDSDMIFGKHKIEINVEVTDDSSIMGKTKSKTNGTKVVKRVIKVGSSEEHLEGVNEQKIDTLRYNKKHLIKEVLEDMTSFNKENYFTNELTESFVDSLINLELKENGIETEYYFGIINKGDNEFTIFKSGGDKNALRFSRYTQPLSPHDIFSNSLILKLHIPNTFGLLLKSIWIMFALSLLFIFTIIFVYIKTVKMFLEQKKVTEVKNDLINNITHEFKTPISAISLASEALAEPKLLEQKDSVKRYSNIIGEENKKLTQLVETLLNTAAFEKSEIELSLEFVDPNFIITRIVEKTKSRNTGIAISFEENFKFSEKIGIDVFHFTNIINNLIDNAVKYSKENVEIIIALKHVNSGIEISVADKGIGIKKSNQQKIFDTFYRVQTGNIHDVKGNGIGLSYVKRIVEAHNGTIKVESKLNVGSTFIIYLPYEK